MDPSQFDPRRPALREAAEALEQALTDACASKSAHDASTGELVRIEEMLALASDAAKRAILLRRQARLRDAAVGPEAATPAEPADQPAAPPTHRLFEDANGVRWDVWAVYPEARSSQLSALPGTFQSGWLVFESASEKRRLSPIPSDWQTLPLTELQRLCQRAETAQPRRRPLGRSGGGSEDSPSRTE